MFKGLKLALAFFSLCKHLENLDLFKSLNGRMHFILLSVILQGYFSFVMEKGLTFSKSINKFLIGMCVSSIHFMCFEAVSRWVHRCSL